MFTSTLSRKMSISRQLIVIGMVVFMQPAPVHNIQANEPWTVTKAADTDDGVCDSDCSLREALSNAVSGDTIQFRSNQTITLRSALPVLDEEITIKGKGANRTIIQASACNPVLLDGNCTPASYSVFSIGENGDVTLDGLTIQFGNRGIVNSGELTVMNSLVWYNSTDSSGAGIYILPGAALDVVKSTISYNSAPDWGGGIVSEAGTLSITDSTFSANHANIGAAVASIGGLGSNFSVVKSSFLANVADDRGGAISNSDRLSVRDCVFYSNSADLGGAIFSDKFGTLTISNSVFSANSGHQSGGGIHSESVLSIESSRFLRNRASVSDGSGGAIYSYNDQSSLTDTLFLANQAYMGAGVYGIGTLTVDGSTFSQNRSMYFGGGIAGGSFTTVTNSTFHANLAVGYGGGIWSGGMLTVTNSTFSENSSGNGSSIQNDGEMYLYNSILANSISGPECGSTANLGSYYNLIEDGSCGAYLAADPRLGPLANNGGLTPTMALSNGSPAIDAGDPSNCPSTDQRGTARTQGSPCDIGAFEKR